MKRIFKYQLSITDSQDILAPQGIEPISVHYQENELMLWALVDDSAMQDVNTFEVLTIRIFGTGHTVHRPDELRFIGTVIDPLQPELAPLVWHIFYEVNE